METAVKGKSDRVFQMICVTVLTILALSAILPFILLFMSSVTDEAVLLKEGYSFFPKKFSLDAYRYLFVTNASNVFRSYGITLLVTVFGTILSLLIGPLLAYPLSRRDYARRRIVTFYVFFTMLFNGGIVPSYIMWTQIFHVKNTIFALILPNLMMSGFNVILMKNYFQNNIHPALLEAAKIDGAKEFQIYCNIVLPLSKPIMASVGLMVAIGYWNDWTNGLYYITDNKLYSLQQLLNNILANVKVLSSLSTAVNMTQNMPSTGIRMAIAVIGVVPIMILYPFFQQYFVKGIALGGVKE